MPKTRKRIDRLVAQAIGIAIELVRNGGPAASSETIAERLDVCSGCEYLDVKHCVLCGCACGNGKSFLNKLAYAASECPDGRWGKAE